MNSLIDLYFEWAESAIGSKVFQPVNPESRGVVKPTMIELFGYFEAIVSKLLTYKTFANQIHTEESAQIPHDISSIKGANNSIEKQCESTTIGGKANSSGLGQEFGSTLTYPHQSSTHLVADPVEYNNS